MSTPEFDDIDSPKPMKSKLPISTNNPHNTSRGPRAISEKEADDLRLKLQEEYRELNFIRSKLKNENQIFKQTIEKLKNKKISAQGVFQMSVQPTTFSMASAISKKPPVKSIFPSKDSAKKPQNCSEDVPYLYVRTD